MNKTFWLLSTFFLAAPVSAFGNAQRFIPRLLGYSGTLSTESHFVSETKQTGGTGGTKTKNKTTAFRELVEVVAVGYSYHPDFFLFSLTGSGVLDQVNDKSSGRKSHSQSSKENYNFKGYLLKRKPLHAEMHYSVDKPFLTGGYSDDSVQEVSRGGLQIFYDKRPYHTSLEYFTDENKSTKRDKISNTYVSRTHYQWQQFSGAMTVRHDSDNTTVVDGNDLYSKTNTLESYGSWFNKIYNASGNMAWSSSESDNSTDKLYNVLGRVKVALPWNFELNNELSRTHRQNEALSFAGRHLTQNIDKINVELTQQLYESLNSKTSVKLTENVANNGSYKTADYELSTNYMKKLWGGSIRGGLATYIKQSQQQGIISISDQKFIRKDGGSSPPYTSAPYILRADANIATVKVEIKLSGSNNTWHILDDANNEYEVQVTNPPQVVIGDVSGVSSKEVVATGPPALYKFRVSYSTKAADYTIQSTSGVGNLGIDLFHGVVQGDYTHSYTVQDIVKGESGIFDLSPDVKDNYFSLAYVKNQLRLQLTYRITSADYEEKELGYNASYTKVLKVLKRVRSSVHTKYERSELDYSSAAENSNSSEYSFSSRLDNAFNIPRTKIHVNHYLSFRRQRGNIIRTTQSTRGVYSRSEGVNASESDAWATGANLNLRLPYIGLPVSLHGSYADESFVSGVDTATWNYGANSGHVWHFGGTSIELNGKYYGDRTTTTRDGGDVRSIDDRFEINVTMTRRLF